MFSIVIPIYKGMPVAKRAIVSALAQVDVQFNVVIIDNGGCKDLAAFVGSLNDHRLIIHTYIDPVKIEDNWARILDIELNKYVTLIGHDDFLYPEFLAEISKAIYMRPNCTLYGSKGNIVDGNLIKVRDVKLTSGKINLKNYLDDRFNFKKDVSGTGFVFSSSNFKSLGGLPKFNKLFFSDDAFWISLLLRGDGFIVEETCYDIMVHQNSVSATSPKIGIDLLAALVSFAVFLNQNLDIDGNTKLARSKDKFLSKYMNLCAILIIIDSLRPGNNLNEDSFSNILQAQQGLLETGSKVEMSKAVFLFRLLCKIIPSYIFAQFCFKAIKSIKQIYKG